MNQLDSEQDEYEDRIHPDDLQFADFLSATASARKKDIVEAIMQAAQKGDKNALKVITDQMSRDAIANEEDKFPITNEQYEEIILATADRIRARRAAQGINT
jgi:hypothetical protein